jgi:hypothetical protein
MCAFISVCVCVCVCIHQCVLRVRKFYLGYGKEHVSLTPDECRDSHGIDDVQAHSLYKFGVLKKPAPITVTVSPPVIGALSGVMADQVSACGMRVRFQTREMQVCQRILMLAAMHQDDIVSTPEDAHSPTYSSVVRCISSR